MTEITEILLNYGALGAVLVYFIYKDLSVNRKLIEHLHTMLDEIKDMVQIIRVQLDMNGNGKNDN